MSKREYISRYNLIIKKIRKKPCDFEEINTFLAYQSELQSYNFTISKRTFQRDLADILSLYNIEIKYDFALKHYYINDEPQKDANLRMLEAFNLFQAFKLSENISEYIHLESRKSDGAQHLLSLFQAIKNKQIVTISYHKFSENKSKTRDINPLAIKESRGRWYLVATDNEDDFIKTYGLDRIIEITVQKNIFEQIPYDVKTYFKYCFGIIRPDGLEPSDVVLTFTHAKGKYIKALPLHESQQILIDNKTEFRIKLTIYITTDFVTELLSYGASMQVIMPHTLIDLIKTEHKQAFKLY